MYKVLVADDEIKIRETISDYLSAKSMLVSKACDGEEAVKKAAEESFDLIILDVMMPKKDGLTACKEIRRFSDVPILFLSALSEEKDYLSGYRSGADDYVAKPFPLSVLYEKTLGLIRRYYRVDNNEKIVVGSITLDNKTRKVFCSGEEIFLSSKDFKILRLLMQNKGQVLEREQILVKIWGFDFDGSDRTVDTHIKRIRKALGKEKDRILTVVGSGYCFKEE